LYCNHQIHGDLLITLYISCTFLILYQKLKKAACEQHSFFNTFPINMKARPPVRNYRKGVRHKSAQNHISRVPFARYKRLLPQVQLSTHYRSQNFRSERLRKSNNRYKKSTYKSPDVTGLELWDRQADRRSGDFQFS
jgi:hypothetical protein